MQRFFLHVQDRSNLILDPDGGLFDSLESAVKEARAAALELMAEALLAGEPLGLHRLVIVDDETGVTVASLSFVDALPKEAK